LQLGFRSPSPAAGDEREEEVQEGGGREGGREGEELRGSK
jgi:hypothetical protein